MTSLCSGMETRFSIPQTWEHSPGAICNSSLLPHSSSTILNIGAQDDNYYLGLDDITVTPIPATLFQPVTQTNGAITFSWNAMTGLVYQVQYKTNLLQANWVNLGNAITATNSTLTATNFISSDPQRFYRLLLLP